MRILITGSSGFLGKLLFAKFRTNNENVIIDGYDINNHPDESLENVSLLSDRLKNVDVVYHLAGVSNPNSFDLHKINVLGTKNIIDVLNRLKSDAKIIFASTFGVYKIPQTGNLISEQYDIEPRNNYGKSKLEAEKIIQSYPKNVILRFSNIYGHSMPAGQHSVVANFIESIKNNNDVLVNDKNATRDFVYVFDAVEALFSVLNFNGSEVFNICSGEETSLLSLISMIESKLHKKANIVIKDGQNSGFWRGDNSKAKKFLNWYPKVSISSGLDMTI